MSEELIELVYREPQRPRCCSCNKWFPLGSLHFCSYYGGVCCCDCFIEDNYGQHDYYYCYE